MAEGDNADGRPEEGERDQPEAVLEIVMADDPNSPAATACCAQVRSLDPAAPSIAACHKARCASEALRALLTRATFVDLRTA